MREVLADLANSWRDGETVALATVIDTSGSSPRQPGASMIVGPGDTVRGSVSGGCVESAVFELGQQVIETGRPVLERYGISDDDAFAIGLTCGGIIDVYVEKVDVGTFSELGDVVAAVREGRPVAIATIVEHPDDQLVGRRIMLGTNDSHGFGGSVRLDDAVRADMSGLLSTGRSGTLTYGPDGECQASGTRVFVRTFARKPRMIVFGAIDFGAALAKLGGYLGYDVTVCDARPIFATKARFPGAEVVVDWPHRYLRTQLEKGTVDANTVLCVLTHDPKFDVPALEVALRHNNIGYIGAMGSRRVHDDRLRRLKEAGLTDTELARLHSPIGLDLGARTPEETALSIGAEIVAARSGGSGSPLAQSVGPIHSRSIGR